MPDVFDRMVDALRHRGPDGRGVWRDDLVSLGHRRLSVLDPTERGAQPMAGDDGRVAVSFNGEIYNHAELRRLMPETEWRSSCDTETILRLYEKEGARFLHRLNGMFAIAIHDRREGRLLLARDRFGIKPLYVCRQKNAFLFASDCKAFLAWDAFDRTPSPEALEEYFLFNYTASARSVFERVRQLPPGHLLTYDYESRKVRTSCWYTGHVDAASKAPASVRPEAAMERFDELFTDAVRARTLSDVPVGVFLSGGLDSSAVACALAHRGAPPTTLTIRVEGDGYDEGDAARDVAARLGTRHVEMGFDARECLTLVQEIPRMLGEPFADASLLPQTILARMAGEHITVALSGDGGDEVLCGYDRYRWLHGALRGTSLLPGALRRRAAELLGSLPHYKTSVLGRGLSFADERDAYAYVFAGWNRDFAESVLGRPCDRALHRIAELSRPARKRAPAVRAAFADLRHYLPGDILAKIDRATMHHSVEARVPFLDHRVVEFALGLPDEAKWSGGTGKLLLREWLRKRLPAHLVDRPKRGFAVPLRHWFRGELRELLEDTLAPDRVRRHGLLDSATVRRTIDLHMGGRWNFERQLWALLVFQLWHDRWIER